MSDWYIPEWGTAVDTKTYAELWDAVEKLRPRGRSIEELVDEYRCEGRIPARRPYGTLPIVRVRRSSGAIAMSTLRSLALGEMPLRSHYYITMQHQGHPWDYAPPGHPWDYAPPARPYHLSLDVPGNALVVELEEDDRGWSRTHPLDDILFEILGEVFNDLVKTATKQTYRQQLESITITTKAELATHLLDRSPIPFVDDVALVQDDMSRDMLTALRLGDGWDAVARQHGMKYGAARAHVFRALGMLDERVAHLRTLGVQVPQRAEQDVVAYLNELEQK